MGKATDLLKVLKEQEGEEIVGSEEVPAETPPAPVNVASVIADKLIDLGLENIAVAVDIVDTDSKISLTSGDVQGVVSFGFEDKKPYVSVSKIGSEDGGVRIDLSGIENIPENDKGGVDLSDVNWISDSIWNSIIAALGLTKIETPAETPAEVEAPAEVPAVEVPEAPTVQEPTIDVPPAESTTKRFEAFKRKRTA